MNNHKFKFLRQSVILFKGKLIEIDIWECINCKKIQIINKDSCKIISLNGRMGEEIKYD